MKKLTCKTKGISYCIEDEDIDSIMPENATEKDYEEKIFEIGRNLPQEMIITVEVEDDAERDEIDELVCDEITETTGWLINSFDYDIIAEASI